MSRDDYIYIAVKAAISSNSTLPQYSYKLVDFDLEKYCLKLKKEKAFPIAVSENSYFPGRNTFIFLFFILKFLNGKTACRSVMQI